MGGAVELFLLHVGEHGCGRGFSVTGNQTLMDQHRLTYHADYQRGTDLQEDIIAYILEAPVAESDAEMAVQDGERTLPLDVQDSGGEDTLVVGKCRRGVDALVGRAPVEQSAGRELAGVRKGAGENRLKMRLADTMNAADKDQPARVVGRAVSLSRPTYNSEELVGLRNPQASLAGHIL